MRKVQAVGAYCVFDNYLLTAVKVKYSALIKQFFLLSFGIFYRPIGLKVSKQKKTTTTTIIITLLLLLLLHYNYHHPPLVASAAAAVFFVNSCVRIPPTL